MKMKLINIILGIVIVLTLGLTACTSGTDVPTSTPTSTPSPTNNPTPTGDDMADLVAGNNAFALDLYHQLIEGDDNLFYSPYSISTALAMTYGGARGQTASAMADTLHFLLPDESLHAAFSNLAAELASREKEGTIVTSSDPVSGPETQTVDNFRLSIVNALWGQQGYDFLPDYLALVEENYGGALRTLDFIGETEPSRLAINDWVSDQTEQRIKDLLAPGIITPDTRLVLTNAIYFKAYWDSQFQKENTGDDTFHLIDGGEVTVPLMDQQEHFAYGEGSDYQAVRLPYMGGEVAMVVLLPKDGEFADFEASLTAERLAEIKSGLETRLVNVTLPKFESENEFDLKDTLKRMGMASAFSDSANFSVMTSENNLAISDVIHKTFVLVDEEGTEAAAATAVIMGITSAQDLPEPPQPVIFRVDRPFIYLIQDIETGTILFMGRMMNPAD
jgi:serine protease inhibitor